MTRNRTGSHSASTSDQFVGRSAPLIESLESRQLLTVMSMGMNLERVANFNAGYMFTDAFQSSRTWISHAFTPATGTLAWEGGGPVSVDANGWPTSLRTFTDASGQTVQQRLGTQMFSNIAGHYPAGAYAVQWRGTATINWGYDVQSVTPQPDTADGAHRALLNVVPTNSGMYMRIDAINPTDPLRDMHVWMPDYNGQSFVGQIWRPGASFSPFHPLFKEKMSPFKTIRFIHATHGVSSDEVNWSDRKTLDAARQGSYNGDFDNGMSWEYAIELANELHENPWLNMPYGASDDYIRNLAQLVKGSLDPDLKVFVEWSDEPWNYSPGYEAHQYLNQQLQLPGNAGLTIYDLWAREMKQDFDVWSSVFTDRPGQVVRVVAGQAANSYVATQLLQRMDGKFDAVSCDGYVTFSQEQLGQFNASTTVDQVIGAMSSQALPNTLQFLRNHEALSQQYTQSLGRQIQTILYEGGPLLFSSGQPYEQAFLSAVRDPRMYGLYEQLLRGASDIGIEEFEAFVFVDTSPFADAGHLRWLDQPLADAHRYRAVVDAASGALFIPEIAITATNAIGDEAAQRPVTFSLTRTGDADAALSVGLSAGGTTSAADYTGLPTFISFAAGERTKTLTVTPVDDSLVEGDETLTVSLLPGVGYRVISGATALASATIRDNDTRVVTPLAIVNPSFETGNLSGWTLLPATGNFTSVAGTFTDPNAPTSPHQGSYFAWGAGTSGQSGGGALSAGVSQRVSVASAAAGIDAGLATITLRGWGAGSGTNNQSAQLELAFLDGSWTQIGSTITSAAVTSLGAWTQMTATGAVPVGTRSVDVRAWTIRPQTHFSNRSGFDDLSGEIEYPLPPAVASTTVNDGAAQRSMVNGYTVRFTVPVTPAAGAFELRQRGGGLITVAATNPTGDRRTWVLGFSGVSLVGGSLADGVYDLTIRAASVRDDSNQAFNGGVDTTISPIRRLFGDSDGDGDVDALDSLRFRQAQGTTSASAGYRAWFDFDNDGDVDAIDALRFRQRVGVVLPS